MEATGSSDPGWVEIVAVLGLILGILANYTNFRNSVAYATRDASKLHRWIKRRTKELWQAFPLSSIARIEREAELLEQQQMVELAELREQFRSAALSLHSILRDPSRFHASELKRQQRWCKAFAIRRMKDYGCNIDSGSAEKDRLAERCDNATLLISLHTDPPREKRLWIVVRWHPNPSLNLDTGHGDEYDLFETLLAAPLTDQELEDAGWAPFAGSLGSRLLRNLLSNDERLAPDAQSASPTTQVESQPGETN